MRYGPFLAAGSTVRAVLAGAVSIVFLAAVVLGLEFLRERQYPPLREMNDERAWIREGLAREILELASFSPKTAWTRVPLAAVAKTPLFFEPVLLIVAILLMPWAAGGDRAWSVWKRSVRNVHWSMTICIPLAIVFAVLKCVPVDGDRWRPWPDERFIVGGFVAFLISLILLLRMWFVGAHRYVGPPDRPSLRASRSATPAATPLFICRLRPAAPSADWRCVSLCPAGDGRPRPGWNAVGSPPGFSGCFGCNGRFSADPPSLNACPCIPASRAPGTSGG
jgi:hypothetical protein